MKTIILVFAHPDDESFSCGALIPKYIKNGWKVNLICATRGEAGAIGPYNQVHGDKLGNIRGRELEDAAQILGISSISYLGYKDGTLANILSGEMEDKIYKKMVEYAPDVVITFDPTGITNHPDHMKVSLSTTYAYQKYCQHLNETRTFIKNLKQQNAVSMKRHFVSQHKVALKERNFTDIVETETEPRLYYACLPTSALEYAQKQKLLPSEMFGKPWKGTPDKFITTVVDGKNFLSTKVRALQAHISQKEDVERFLTLPSVSFVSQEFFILRMVGLTEVFMGKNDRVRDRL